MTHFLSVAASLLAASLLAACGGNTSAGAQRTASLPDPTGAALTLDTAVAEDLVFLREEEKLARDVYLRLGQSFPLPVFENIPASEQRHMDAVLSLLQAAGIGDPAAGKEAGVFVNGDLAALYAALVAKGATSTLEAFRAGATIEDYDLADLARASRRTTDPTVLAVYANLSRGSRNHLRAFARQLAAAGGSYAPQFIDAATYDSIVNSPMERGR